MERVSPEDLPERTTLAAKQTFISTSKYLRKRMK
jgi:hypothetical protein